MLQPPQDCELIHRRNLHPATPEPNDRPVPGHVGLGPRADTRLRRRRPQADEHASECRQAYDRNRTRPSPEPRTGTGPVGVRGLGPRADTRLRRRRPQADEHASGGGGNRTRVLRYITRASPGAACCAFLSPGGHAGKPPTGSVAVWCPAQTRDRTGRWILLADARHRAGGSPGLTTSNSRSGREGEVSALNVGTYWFAVTGLTRLCPQSSTRFPWINYQSRSLSPPVELSGDPHGRGRGLHHDRRYRVNAIRPTQIPGGSARGRRPPTAGHVLAGPRHENAPVGAGGGRDAPTGADRQGRGRSNARASPEMRPGSHHDDWAATPKRHPVTM
jgi:hypothetical protein